MHRLWVLRWVDLGMSILVSLGDVVASPVGAVGAVGPHADRVFSRE